MPSLDPSYRVFFDSAFGRADVQSSARLGFLLRNSSLLQAIRVEVIGADPLIRKYTLAYELGEFGKQRLASVSVSGIDGATNLYTHTFNYRSAERFGGHVGFAQPTLYANTPIVDQAGTSQSVGGNAHLGVGDIYHMINFGVGLGGGVQRSRSSFERVDVNGDGLPDLLNGSLYNQARTEIPAERFSTPSSSNTGHSNFGESSARTGQLNAGLQIFEMGAGGLDGAWSWNDTHRILSDANGDGFVDLVTGPHDLTIMGASTKVLRVFENPTPHGRTTFGAMGGAQPDYTIGGIDVQPPRVDITDSRLADAITQQNVPTAPLVQWRVLKEGSVRITGAIDHPDTRGDGVVAEIYLAHGPFSQTPIMPIWTRPISATDPPCTPGPANSCGTGLDIVNLARDDRLYFVVRPGPDTAATVEGDRVNWVTVQAPQLPVMVTQTF